jgi:hypothetical protein
MMTSSRQNTSKYAQLSFLKAITKKEAKGQSAASPSHAGGAAAIAAPASS